MRIANRIEIASTPDQVFPWIAEPEAARRWQRGVEQVEILRSTPEVVGTRFREVVAEGNGSLEMSGEVTGYQPDRSISFRLESRLHAIEVTYSVARQGARSTVEVDTTIRWKFPMNVISLFVGRRMKAGIQRQTAVDLTGLKLLCEAGVDAGAGSPAGIRG
jgi:uncharacterized protein YndB with AHSA1/START domain